MASNTLAYRYGIRDFDDHNRNYFEHKMTSPALSNMTENASGKTVFLKTTVIVVSITLASALLTRFQHQRVSLSDTLKTGVVIWFIVYLFYIGSVILNNHLKK
jgi:hypothetical protein